MRKSGWAGKLLVSSYADNAGMCGSPAPPLPLGSLPPEPMVATLMEQENFFWKRLNSRNFRIHLMHWNRSIRYRRFESCSFRFFSKKNLKQNNSINSYKDLQYFLYFLLILVIT